MLNEESDIFIKDIVSHPDFAAYDRWLKERETEKTAAMFRKPCASDEFSKDLKYKIGYIQAIKDIINLNEEARK